MKKLILKMVLLVLFFTTFLVVNLNETKAAGGGGVDMGLHFLFNGTPGCACPDASAECYCVDLGD